MNASEMQQAGRAGWPIMADMTLAEVREANPAACERLQALGVPEPILCGPYLHRTIADLARAEAIPLPTLLNALGREIEFRKTRLSANEPGVAYAGRSRPAKRFAGADLSFDLGQELEALRHEPEWQLADHNAKTLAKEPDLRVVLVALKSGAILRDHHAAARISIQTLAGRIRLHLPNRMVDLGPGDLLMLERDVHHDVEALEESGFLLTVAWSAHGNA